MNYQAGDDCRNCHRPTRLSHEPATARPGTIAYGSRGYCSSCADHLREYGTFDGWSPGPRRGPGSNGATGPHVRLMLTPEPWTDRALCAETDPETFYPDEGQSTRPAKAVCGCCDVRGECLEYALTNREPFGVWGGLSERERRVLSRGKI